MHKDIKDDNVLYVKRKYSEEVKKMIEANPELSEYFDKEGFYYPLLIDYNVSDKCKKVNVYESGAGQISRLVGEGIMKKGEKTPAEVDSIELYDMVKRFLKNVKKEEMLNKKLNEKLFAILEQCVGENEAIDYTTILAEIASQIHELICRKNKDEESEDGGKYAAYMEIQRKIFKEYEYYLETFTGQQQNQSTTYLSCNTWGSLGTPAKFEELMLAAKNGNFDALITSGLAFQYGICVPRDIYQAVFQFAQAAKIKDEGNECLKNTFCLMLDEHKIPLDEEKIADGEISYFVGETFRLLEKDAKLHDPVAEARLGIILAEKYLSKEKKNPKMKEVAFKYLNDAKGKVNLISIQMALCRLLIDDGKFAEAFEALGKDIKTPDFDKMRMYIYYKTAKQKSK